MAENDVRGVRQAFDAVRAGLPALRTGLRMVTDRIDEEKYVSADDAAALVSALSGYRTLAERLERAASALSVPIGDGLSDLSEAITAFEENQMYDQLREQVLDYFRLTTDPSRAGDKLEESKRALMKKCAASGERLIDELLPYTYAVEHVRGSDPQLPDDRYSLIDNTFDGYLINAVENRQIVYDEAHDVTAYLDGSCRILAPFHTSGKIDDPAKAQEAVPSKSEQVLGGYASIISPVACEYTGNKPASEFHLSLLRSAVRKMGDIPAVLKWFAEEKLYSPEQDNIPDPALHRPPYAEAMKYLIQFGYLAKISIISSILTREYYTLSDKGWACFTKKDGAQFSSDFRAQDGCVDRMGLSTPSAVLMSTADLDGFTAVRLALIHEFFTRAKKDAILLKTPDTGSVLGLSVSESPILACAAVLDGKENPQCFIDCLAALIKTRPENGELVLIVACRQDASILLGALPEECRTADRIRFSIADEDFVLTEAPGQADATSKEAPPERAAESGQGVAEDSAFVSALKHSDALFPADASFGQLITKCSSAEDKKVTSKIFLKDMRKGNETAIKSILKRLNDRRMVTRDQLVTVKKMPEAVVQSVLDFLYTKGYLRRFHLLNAGEFYCASPRLERALQFETANQYVGIYRLNKNLVKTGAAETVEGAAVRLASLALDCDAQARLAEKKITDVTGSIMLKKTSFVSRIRGKTDGEEAEIFIGAMWKTTDECDGLFEEAEGMLQKTEHVSRLTFVSYTLEKAEALKAAYLEASVYVGKSAQIAVYSIKDQRYSA